MESLQFIKVIDGKEKVCDVIATYKDDNTNKNYIIYTDRSISKDNKINIFYSLYEKVDNNIKLITIKDIEDKKICLNIINELIKDIEGVNNEQGNK